MRSEDYYNTYIEKKHARTQQMEEVLHTVVEQRGAHDKGARNGYLFLANHYLDRIIAMYSAGRPLHEISSPFPGVIELMEKSWNGENYEQMLQVLSIGVALGIEAEECRQTNLVEKALQDRSAATGCVLLRREEKAKSEIRINPSLFLLKFQTNTISWDIFSEYNDFAVNKRIRGVRWREGQEINGYLLPSLVCSLLG